MEIKINREIRNYTESMFFGLSARQFFFSLAGIGAAVGLYFLLRPYVGTETLSWACMLGAAPFIAMGFITYNGMTAEQFVIAFVKSKFIEPHNVKFECGILYHSDRADSSAKSAGKNANKTIGKTGKPLETAGHNNTTKDVSADTSGCNHTKSDSRIKTGNRHN